MSTAGRVAASPSSQQPPCPPPAAAAAPDGSSSCTRPQPLRSRPPCSPSWHWHSAPSGHAAGNSYPQSGAAPCYGREGDSLLPDGAAAVYGAHRPRPSVHVRAPGACISRPSSSSANRRSSRPGGAGDGGPGLQALANRGPGIQWPSVTLSCGPWGGRRGHGPRRSLGPATPPNAPSSYSIHCIDPDCPSRKSHGGAHTPTVMYGTNTLVSLFPIPSARNLIQVSSSTHCAPDSTRNSTGHLKSRRHCWHHGGNNPAIIKPDHQLTVRIISLSHDLTTSTRESLTARR